MAAQELAKQAQQHKQVTPAPVLSEKEEDLLISLEDNPPPPFEAVPNPPPPAFQDSFLPPPPQENQYSVPPPAFSADLLGIPEVAPPPMSFQVPEQPSAPPMEDAIHSQMHVLPPPQTDPAFDFDIDGLEMSPAEKQAMIDEQRRIMEQINAEKTANETAIAEAAAEAFDMRSNTRVAAILQQDQPLRRSDFGGATSRRPREHATNWGQEAAWQGQEHIQAGSDEAAALELAQRQAEELQMEEDFKLAEMLQQEELQSQRADARQSANGRSVTNAPVTSSSSGSSWISSMFGSWAKPAAATTTTAPPPPPTTSSSRAASRALSDDHSETISFITPDVGGARVAESKPLFQCVVDSVSTVTDALTSQSLYEDREGNVHGVDASSLLVTTNATRARPDGSS